MEAGDFLTGTNWNQGMQTEDLNVEWAKNSPCFKLTGEKSGNRAKAQQVEYNEKPLDANGITVYYDATLSNCLMRIIKRNSKSR